MAGSVFSIQYLKDFLNSQIHDEEKWAFNMLDMIKLSIENMTLSQWGWALSHGDTYMKLLRAAGLFGGSILLMRNYGDLMAI